MLNQNTIKKLQPDNQENDKVLTVDTTTQKINVNIIIRYILLISLLVSIIGSILVLTQIIPFYTRIKVNKEKIFIIVDLLSSDQILKNLVISNIFCSSISFFTILFFNKSNNYFKELFVNLLVGATLINTVLFFFSLKEPKYNMTIASFSVVFFLACLAYLIYNFATLLFDNKKSKVLFTTKQLTESSMLVAVTVLLSFLADLIMPKFPASMGGFRVSITYLPLIIIALRNGPIIGALSGLSYGMFNSLLDGGFSHIGSLFLDYLIPYSLFGIVGIKRSLTNRSYQKSLPWLILLIGSTAFGIYISHSFSGILFFKQYAPEKVHYALYSFVYVNLPAVTLKTLASTIIYTPFHFALIDNKRRVI